MKKSGFHIIIHFLLLSLFFTGCWSSHEVNSLGITVCLGIDKGPKGYIISEQVLNPKAIASQKAVNESPTVVFSEEGENIQETIIRMTTMTSRKIYSPHLRMVVISEEIAREGIGDIVDYLLRYHEYRTDFFFAIAKGSTAKEILSTVTPIESIAGIDMFNMLSTSYQEWAPTQALRVIELANNLAAEGVHPVITGIERTKEGSSADTIDTLKKAGDYEKLKYTAVGAFRNDRLVGWLNEQEAKGLNYIRGKVKHTSGYVSDNKGIEITYDVLKSKSKTSGGLKNNQPEIRVKISLDCRIVAVQGDLDVSKAENIDILQKLAEEKLISMCKLSVEKAQKELETDIFGFGEVIHREYPVYWKTAKDRWDEIFPDLPVTIEAEVKINTTGDLKKSILQNK